MTASNQKSLQCFHCGLPAQPKFAAEINGQHQDFCCPGCRAVALLIQDSGLDDFYKYREELPFKPPAFVIKGEGEELNDFSIYDDEEYQRDFVRVTRANSSIESTEKIASLQIYGMNCSACAWLIEKQLEKIPAIKEARVNYSQRTLYLHWKPNQALLSELLLHISNLGFEFSPKRQDSNEAENQQEEQLFLRRIGVAGIGMMQVGMYAMAGYFGATESTLSVLRFASLLIATLVIFYAAKPFFLGAWRAISHRYLSMDVPVALALGLAYAASLIATWQGGLNSGVSGEVYFDAICMFTLFLLVSRYFEFKARSRWQSQQLAPSTDDRATLIDSDGEYRQVASRSLSPDQRILVKTGDVFPVDAALLSDRAEISQAQLTGEFSPVSKYPDQEISSGSINLGEPVEASVLRPVNQSTLSQITHLVTQAQLHKPRISGLADQISGYFVAVVLTLASASYLFWLQESPQQAFWIALSVLVVSCPCALSLATPTALTVLMNHLHSKGIFVQHPAALEKLQQVDHVLFDKTGTLTKGEFQVDWFQDLSGEGSETHWQRAAVLERNSNHPIAHAFLSTHAFQSNGIEKSDYQSTTDQQTAMNNCTDWKAFQGQGVEARIDGVLMRIGDKAFVCEIIHNNTELNKESNKEDDAENETNAALSSDDQQKLIYLGNSEKILAVFALSDTLRTEAEDLVELMRQRKKGMGISIFSGDQSEQVNRVSNALKIEDARYGMKPAEKMSALKQLQQDGRCILAVGDGINDTPLLASADISIAVSNAVDMSKQKADFILLSNNLLSIDELFKSAIQGKRIIAQNLSWALAYNLCAIPLAMMGLVPPWLAALGMSASSTVVVLNAFRARGSRTQNNQEKIGYKSTFDRGFQVSQKTLATQKTQIAQKHRARWSC